MSTANYGTKEREQSPTRRPTCVNSDSQSTKRKPCCWTPKLKRTTSKITTPFKAKFNWGRLSFRWYELKTGWECTLSHRSGMLWVCYYNSFDFICDAGLRKTFIVFTISDHGILTVKAFFAIIVAFTRFLCS